MSLNMPMNRRKRRTQTCILDNSVEGPKSNFSRQTMMVLAVTLHNIPEGMAVGVLYASWISGTTTITRAAALSLAIGIAIQNFPEGAIMGDTFTNGVEFGKMGRANVR